MDLSKPTQENLKFLLNELGELLDVANRFILDEKDYDLNRYDDIKFLYEHVKHAGSLSPQETYELIDELRKVRK